MTERTILITGANGQVGYELARTMQGLGRVIALDRAALDLSNLDAIRSTLRDLEPAVVVNAAAYTAVDRAESDKDAAYRLNAEAPGVLAQECAKLNALVIHYSTDYVFDGTKQGAYVEDDTTNPQNVYGASKLSGERAVIEAGGAHLIFRTSWVYGVRGANFVRTMLRLGSERDELRVVADQTGAPTWSNTIATSTAHVVASGLGATTPDYWHQRSGVYHLTAGGEASWYDLACATFEIVMGDAAPRVVPIEAREYPTPARRPANSCMSNEALAARFGVRQPHWRRALELCLAKDSGAARVG
ncbi:dTDP-4-dehydrorhamnose reductase [Caballeronia sp. GAFFF3]|uniref:dTDP-4-dehydrorhamnose reductase n=1 Tax=Caballeronia sp. GAFFF3 TaxID=2921759 RepID=UPI002027BA4B|nr:dTDP-4-dehydrorhamnose reductase [Caballeronia sp. GAFFF3]